MRHGSLFSGIGGFDLAAEWMGWDNIFHCEIEEFPSRILKYYWPTAISYGDIKTTDFNIHRGRIDILTGGFPCQPYSQAGKRLGKEDDRHLWPEMLRAIREIQPRWIVGENVYGLVNWNGGMVFDEVQADLEAEGYEVQPVILPACAVNAPHRRDRVWFIAHRSCERCNNRGDNREKRHLQDDKWAAQKDKSEGNGRECGACKARKVGVSANPDGGRQPGKEYRQEETRRTTKESISDYWKNFPTVSPICNGDDGLSARLDNITFPKWRNESIKGGGNAVVPQVVYKIFKTIERFENC